MYMNGVWVAWQMMMIFSGMGYGWCLLFKPWNLPASVSLCSWLLCCGESEVSFLYAWECRSFSVMQHLVGSVCFEKLCCDTAQAWLFPALCFEYSLCPSTVAFPSFMLHTSHSRVTVSSLCPMWPRIMIDSLAQERHVNESGRAMRSEISQQLVIWNWQPLTMKLIYIYIYKQNLTCRRLQDGIGTWKTIPASYHPAHYSVPHTDRIINRPDIYSGIRAS